MYASQKGALPVLAFLVALILAGGGIYFAVKPAGDRGSMPQDSEKVMKEVEQTDGQMMEEPLQEIKESASIMEGGEMADKDATMQKETPVRFEGAMLAGGTSPLLDFTKSDYDAALGAQKLVVLYFYANWCPLCKAETAEALYPAFDALDEAGVIGFRVNYNDNETDADEKALAREFGVGYQHTKVIVKDGKRILKSPEGWNTERYIREIKKALNPQL